ncbi:MAG: hypothetical protein ACLTYN_03425 [Dysosmobacter welbionis]
MYTCLTPMDGAELDMSFSGLKTAVVNLAHHVSRWGVSGPGSAGSGLRPAVSDTLVPRAMEAAKQTGRTVFAPPAARQPANSVIGRIFVGPARRQTSGYTPPLKLCGDNGMIGAQGNEYLAGIRLAWANAYATGHAD